LPDDHYFSHFAGPVELLVIGDNNVVYQYLDGQQRQVPFLAPPRPPYDLVGRDDLLVNLRKTLVDEGSLGLVALDGRPGIGKTALATEVANDHEILKHFTDGVLWSGLGKSGEILLELARWGAALGVSESDLQRARTVKERARLIHSAIGLKQMLLVVNDAWTVEDALAFKIGGPNCAHIVTSRLPAVAESFAGPNTILVPELNDKHARELLRQVAGDLPGDLEDNIQILLDKLGGLPFSVLLLGTYLRGEWRHGDSARLERALAAAFDSRMPLSIKYVVSPLEQHPSLPAGSSLSLPTIIGISYDALDGPAQTFLKALALFPPKPNTFSEIAALQISGESSSVLKELVDRRLVDEVRTGRYTLHQSTWDFGSQFEQNEVNETRFTEFFLSLLEESTKSVSDISSEVSNIRSALALARLRDAERFEEGVLLFTPYLIQMGSYQTAADYLRDAESTADARHSAAERRVRILAEEGTILFRLGSYGEAEAKLRTALDLAPGSIVTSSIFGDLGSMAERRGQYQLAEEFFAKGIELATSLGDDATLASIFNEAGWVSISRGRYGDAEARFSSAYRYAESTKSPDLQSAVLLHWGWARIKEGQLQSADELLERGLVIAQTINYQERIAALLINLGVSAEKQGKYANAEEWDLRALAIAEKLGSPEKLSAILTNLGLLAEYRGSYCQAEEYGQRALVFARAIPHSERISNLLQNLSSVATYRGRFEEALVMNADALELAKEIGHPERITYILQERASIFLQMNSLPEGEGCLLEGLGIAKDLGNPERTATLKGCMAELAIQKGDYDLAQVYLEEAERGIGAIGHLRHESLLLVIRGEMELARDRHEEAGRAFENALRLAQNLSAIPIVADAEYGLARYALAINDRTAAIARGRQAQQLFTGIGHFKAELVNRWLEEIE